MNKQIKAAIITPEAVPYAKTGGLADVAGVLPSELKKLGQEAILIMPYYKSIKTKGIGSKLFENVYMVKDENDVHVYFIDNEIFFGRDALYGTASGDYEDNAQRFGYFCKEVIKILPRINFRPDIVHVNDWQTGLIPFYLKTDHSDDPFFKSTKTLFTIHNLAYQGLFPMAVLTDIGISRRFFVPHGGLEFYGKVNYLKAGLISADAINTVSKKYGYEIQTEEYGCGLQGVLLERKEKVFGILNGVDYSQWSPEADKYLAKNYSYKNLNGKADCRKDLLKEFNMAFDETSPVIGSISRLIDQKGFDIISECMEDFVKLGIKFILLGSGEERYQTLFKEYHKKYPENIGVKIEFNNSIAHKIEAGCDMFLMPSRFEPCGLNQIYSLKYGTVPIVRATGGLDDTITDFNLQTLEGNGFKFSEYSRDSMLEKIKTALELFENKKTWRQIMINGMEQDFSWANSALQYIELYRNILNPQQLRQEVRNA